MFLSSKEYPLCKRTQRIIAQRLRSVGVDGVLDVKDAHPGRLHNMLGKYIGVHADRCVLHAFRSAVCFASKHGHDPKKPKWWDWQG